MAEFAPAYNFMAPHEVLRYHQPGEVAYTDTPGDKGGPRAWGITEATAREHGFSAPMSTMMELDAIYIYKAAYWKFAEVENQRVASKLFDAAVNMGVSRAVKQAQRALRFAPQDWDGKLGPVTLRAINAADPKLFLADYCAQLISRYHAIVAQDPSQEKFLLGWTIRALALPPEAR